MVLHEEYFYPQANGATVEKEWCHGKVGVDNQLIFSFDKVSVVLNVRQYKGIVRLGIAFEINEDGIIVWPSQTVIVHIDSTRKDLTVRNFERLCRVIGSDELLKKRILCKLCNG